MRIRHLFMVLPLVALFVSCESAIDEKELPQVSSSLEEFKYPLGTGSSGDGVYGLLGYGYDATGFCDTVSVKAKVFAAFPPSGSCVVAYPRTTFPVLLSESSFSSLSERISFMDYGETLARHLKSLLKLAGKSTLIDSTCAFGYYAITAIDSHNYMYLAADKQQYLSAAFKNDAVKLSTEELVSKYGTHVLTNVYSGSKFEILYLCNIPKNSKNSQEFSNPVSGSECEKQFYYRMIQFIGGTPGILMEPATNDRLSGINEMMIYNSIGSKKKVCGMVNATDYNPDSVRIDMASVFADGNLKSQFLEVGKDGIVPLYEFIADATKKQQLKTYIDNYLENK